MPAEITGLFLKNLGLAAGILGYFNPEMKAPPSSFFSFTTSKSFISSLIKHDTGLHAGIEPAACAKPGQVLRPRLFHLQYYLHMVCSVAPPARNCIRQYCWHLDKIQPAKTSHLKLLGYSQSMTARGRDSALLLCFSPYEHAGSAGNYHVDAFQIELPPNNPLGEVMVKGVYDFQ